MKGNFRITNFSFKKKKSLGFDFSPKFHNILGRMIKSDNTFSVTKFIN